MWYGCLPSMAVIIVAMAIPNISIYFINKYIVGNPYRRYVSNKYECLTYLRDIRLGDGDPYKQLGLDGFSYDSAAENEACKCA